VNVFDQWIVDLLSDIGVASKPLHICMQSTFWQKF